jgi:sarcosine oxidase subunit gamma
VPDTAQLVRVSPLLNADQAIVDCDGLKLQARQNTTSIQVMAFKNRYAATADALGATLGITCPTRPGVCNHSETTQLVWNGPNQWMVIDGGRASDSLLPVIQRAVQKHAAVIDQSHGRSGLRLSGQHARAVLQKNCALDLHRRSFVPGNCALTMIAHIAALLIQLDDVPSYDMFVNRSFARSFAHSVAHSCEQFMLR